MSAPIAMRNPNAPQRSGDDRCRCADCGAFVSEEEYLPCRRCGSARRKLCNECYEGYLDWRAFQMGYL